MIVVHPSELAADVAAERLAQASQLCATAARYSLAESGGVRVSIRHACWYVVGPDRQVHPVADEIEAIQVAVRLLGGGS